MVLAGNFLHGCGLRGCKVTLLRHAIMLACGPASSSDMSPSIVPRTTTSPCEIAGARKQSAATGIAYGLALGYLSCIVHVMCFGVTSLWPTSCEACPGWLWAPWICLAPWLWA